MLTLRPVTVPTTAALVLPVKSTVLNHDRSLNVRVDEPDVIAKLGAIDAEPLVVPNVNVLVTDASVTNPPVPLQVKFCVCAIATTVAPAVVVVNIILPVPNAMARAVIPVELKVPVDKLNPLRFIAPALNVNTPVVVNEYAFPKFTVPDVQVNVGTALNVPEPAV